MEFLNVTDSKVNEQLLANNYQMCTTHK